jgi:hypothetical protein
MTSTPPPPGPPPHEPYRYPPQAPPGPMPGPGPGWAPPGPPTAPPAGGSGGPGKVVLVVLVLAVLGAAAAFFLLGNDDSNDGAGTGTGGGAASPEQVTRSFIEAARSQDCETLLGLVSQNSFGGAEAGRDQQLAACQAMEVVAYEFTVTDVAVTAEQGTTATVLVTADVPGGTATEEFDLVQEDSAWKVDLAAGEATAGAAAEATPSTFPPGG